MDFSKLKEKKDPQQFQNAILKKDYVALYQYHKQWTPWVSDEQILKYLEEYDAQIKLIDQRNQQLEMEMKIQEKVKIQMQSQLSIEQQQQENLQQQQIQTQIDQIIN